MLAGLAHPTGGEMRVLGFDPQKERVAMLERTGFMIDQIPAAIDDRSRYRPNSMADSFLRLE